MKQLRAGAKIEYVGDFAAGATPSSPPAPNAGTPKTDEKSAIDKGISGLR
jgi:hypothetical protein